MRGKRTRYTLVMEFRGGTYVRQAYGESPELALRTWLYLASEEIFEWVKPSRAAAARTGRRERRADRGLSERMVRLRSCRRSHFSYSHHRVGGRLPQRAKALRRRKWSRMGIDPKRWGYRERW